jgi:hypothetical protein
MVGVMVAVGVGVAVRVGMAVAVAVGVGVLSGLNNFPQALRNTTLMIQRINSAFFNAVPPSR